MEDFTAAAQAGQQRLRVVRARGAPLGGTAHLGGESRWRRSRRSRSRLVDGLDEGEEREAGGVTAERGDHPRPPPAHPDPLSAAEERSVQVAEEGEYRGVLEGLREDQVEGGGLHEVNDSN